MRSAYMLDIETTGLDPEHDELLQIGIVHCTFDDAKWIPGRSLEIIQHTDCIPRSEFAKKYMAPLYERCSLAEHLPPASIRGLILDFMAECGPIGRDALIMGKNVGAFDLPFLNYHQMLRPPAFVTMSNDRDVAVGDYSHRVYDINGAISILQDLSGLDHDAILAHARAQFPMSGEEHKHDAIYDCLEQIRILNGLLNLLRIDLLRRR